MFLILYLILKAIWKIIEGWDVTYITTIRSLGIDIITLGVFCGVLTFSIVTFFTVRKRFRLSQFIDLRKEYGSPEIGIAIRRLWELRKECNDEEKFTNEYARLSKEDKYKKECIHIQRRMVSHMYQVLVQMWLDHFVPTEILARYWCSGDFDIIGKVIKPLELRGVPKVKGDDPTPEEKRPEWLRQLERLQETLCNLEKKGANDIKL